MKQAFLIFLFLLSTLIFIQAEEPSEYSKEEPQTKIVWRLNTSLHFMPGLTFNRLWDPGYTGTALTCTLSAEIKRFIFEAGVEAGYSYTGFNILFPMKAGFIFAGNEKLQFYGNIYLMPGMIMARPSPWFQFSAGTTAGLRWQMSKRFSLAVFTGLRVTASPDYSATVFNYELLDFDLGLTAGFKLGR